MNDMFQDQLALIDDALSNRKDVRWVYTPKPDLSNCLKIVIVVVAGGPSVEIVLFPDGSWRAVRQ